MSFLNEYNKFMSKFYLFCRHNRCNSTCPLYDISETYKDVACKQLLFTLPDKAIAIVEEWYTAHQVENRILNERTNMTNLEKFHKVFGFTVDCLAVKSYSADDPCFCLDRENPPCF